MTTTPALTLANTQRTNTARARLAHLSNLVFGEGFLPDVAAAAAGYPDRRSALRAARHAGRPALADALRPPSTAERRAAQIEDIEFLLIVGEAPERAALRCGFASLDTAWTLLRRWGRPDLATQLLAGMAPLDADEETTP